MTARGRVVAGVALGLLVAACGGGDGQTESPAQTTSTEPAVELASSTTEAATESAIPAQTTAVGLSAVFDGFRWHVVEARLGESLGLPTLFVIADVENLGSEDETPRSKLGLQTPGGLIESFGIATASSIAPGAIENVAIEFPVDPGFNADGSVLLIGRSGNAQASVSLTGGEVVSLEPFEVIVDGVGTAEAVELRLDRVGVDWHSLAFGGESAAASTAFLTAIVDITLGDRSRTAKDTFELMLPSGETVTPERAPNEVLDAGVTAESLEVAFIIPDPIAGNYVIRLLNLSRFPEDTVAEVPFTLGG